MGIAIIFFNNKEENCVPYLRDAISQINHTGQEHSGISVYDPYNDNRRILRITKNGHVRNLEIPENIESYSGIGNVSKFRDHQPLYFETSPLGEFSLSFDGFIRNREELRKELKIPMFSKNDAELAAHLISLGDNFPDGIQKMSDMMDGCFSVGILTGRGELYAARCPKGTKPLLYGHGKRGYGVISESRAFRKVGMVYEGDFEPGEIITIDDYGTHTIKKMPTNKVDICSFLWGYYSWVDSYIEGVSVAAVREAAAKKVAERDKKNGLEIDVASAIEDSGKAYGEGAAEFFCVPYKSTLIKYPYFERSYDKPGDGKNKTARDKVSTVDVRITGKKMSIWDDSLRRGTVIHGLMDLLKKSQPKEIHLRFGTPRNTHFCPYDYTDQSDNVLPANRYPTNKELAEYIQVDSVDFPSLDEWVAAIEETSGGKIKKEVLCLKCFE